MAMRWKMANRETGLRAVCAPPRSHWLREDGQRFACVSPIDRSGSAWYWVAGWGSGVPHKNTCDAPVPTIQEAKEAAAAYVKAEIAAMTRERARTDKPAPVKDHAASSASTALGTPLALPS